MGHGSSILEYRLTMLEPVLQGHAEQESTRVIILPASDDTPTTDIFVNGIHKTSYVDGLDDEHDDLEIDEGFLANSLNSHIPNGVGHLNTVLSTPDDSHHSLLSSSPGHEFTAQPLSSISHPEALSAGEFTVFVRTSDLPRVGIQDGDWVRYLFCKMGQGLYVSLCFRLWPVRDIL